jgi:serine/threonine protein phosphatase PrpC
MQTMTLDLQTAALPARPPAPRRAMSDRHVVAIALATGFLGMFLSATAEALVIRAVGATGHQLEWISDVMAAVAVSTLTYLWLHLRTARAQLLDSERTLVAVDAQFRLAAEIQRSLLPQVPAETPGYRWAARMEAAYQVGGDFYDFLTTPDGAVLLILGDVSGKGMSAALLQSSLTTLFRVHGSMTADPCTIAARMSQALYEQTGGRPYATAIIARVDCTPRRITYVNAGHPPGLVMRDTTLFELRAGGPPLGLLPTVPYECGSLDFLSGDFCVLVTDGVTEAVDDLSRFLRGLVAGPARVRSGKAGAGLTTPKDACDYLLRAASHGPGPAGVADWTDDRTVVAFRVSD